MHDADRETSEPAGGKKAPGTVANHLLRVVEHEIHGKSLLSRKAEAALADDVPLDLVGTHRDRLRNAVHPVIVHEPIEWGEGVTHLELAHGAHQLEADLPEHDVEFRRHHLVHRRVDIIDVARLHRRHDPVAQQPGGPVASVESHQARSHRWALRQRLPALVRGAGRVLDQLIEKFGEDQCDKKLCKQAIRELIDSGKCTYSYVGGSYIVLPPES